MDPNQNPINPPTPGITNPPLDPSQQIQPVQPVVDAPQTFTPAPQQPEYVKQPNYPAPQPATDFQAQPPAPQPTQQFAQQPPVAQQPIMQQPIAAAPAQTFTPAPVAGQPVQPQVQPGVIGGYPQQQGYPTMAPSAAPGGKFGGMRQKLGLVVPVIGVLIAGVVFAINSGIFAKGVALTEYSNESYSILVPEDYEKDDAYSSQVEFTKKDTPSGSEPSTLLILREDIGGGDINDAKSSIEDSFNEDIIKEEFGSSSVIKDFKKENVSHKGTDALKMSATVEQGGSSDDKAKGSVIYYVVYHEDALYLLTLFANGNDHGYSKQFDKIIDSFTIKS